MPPLQSTILYSTIKHTVVAILQKGGYKTYNTVYSIPLCTNLCVQRWQSLSDGGRICRARGRETLEGAYLYQDTLQRFYTRVARVTAAANQIQFKIAGADYVTDSFASGLLGTALHARIRCAVLRITVSPFPSIAAMTIHHPPLHNAILLLLLLLKTKPSK
jgi:hypothetical protein